MSQWTLYLTSISLCHFTRKMVGIPRFIFIAFKRFGPIFKLSRSPRSRMSQKTAGPMKWIFAVNRSIMCQPAIFYKDIHGYDLQGVSYLWPLYFKKKVSLDHWKKFHKLWRNGASPFVSWSGTIIGSTSYKKSLHKEQIRWVQDQIFKKLLWSPIN
jgi:hypothetical protein